MQVVLGLLVHANMMHHFASYRMQQLLAYCNMLCRHNMLQCDVTQFTD